MRIMITGASGYFAGELIRQLQRKQEFEVIALSSEPDKIKKKYKDVRLVSNTELMDYSTDLSEIDIVVHTAFCRKSNGTQLVESLKFMRRIARWSLDHGVKGFINLSSQAVFGSSKGELPDESGKLNPEYLYALAKSASEILLEEMATDRMIFTNIRLAALIGPCDSVPDNVLYKFVCRGLEGKQFRVVGGKQNFSFLDISDAAEAVSLFIQVPLHLWEKTYNLGPERQTNILEMANCVCEKVMEIAGIGTGYEFLSDDTQLNAGMDSRKIYQLLDWRPRYPFEKIVEDTIKYLMKNVKENKNA